MEANSILLNKPFQDEVSCYAYLTKIKWLNGYICKKCGHTYFCSCRKKSSWCCSRCKYDESPTSGTFLDKCRLPLYIAFHLALRVSKKKKEVSSSDILHDFQLITDDSKGCLSLNKEHCFLEQHLSDKGNNSPEFHIHIMNIQGWLRGIHYHFSNYNLQGYSDEYSNRYNR